MSSELVLVSLAALALSCLITPLVRRQALSRGMLDEPNARSSHTVPTPRGGGVSIVAAVTAGAAYLWLAGIVEPALALAVILGGGAIALAGFVDDRRSLPPGARIVVHVAAAVGAVALLGGTPPLAWGAAEADLGLIGDVISVIAIVWAINLFNFMDGIDGIAASEAAFIAGAGAWLALAFGGSWAVSSLGLVVAAASVGFLVWNWPPAKIFMGDVGSGYLGYLLAVLALWATRENGVAAFAWLILGAAFLADATVTLLRRLASGQNVLEAHRSHAYQRLALRWSSHLRVTVLVWAVNLAWLLPLAVWCYRKPSMAGWAMLTAFLPIVIATRMIGAGEEG